MKRPSWMIAPKACRPIGKRSKCKKKIRPRKGTSAANLLCKIKETRRAARIQNLPWKLKGLNVIFVQLRSANTLPRAGTLPRPTLAPVPNSTTNWRWERNGVLIVSCTRKPLASWSKSYLELQPLMCLARLLSPAKRSKKPKSGWSWKMSSLRR